MCFNFVTKPTIKRLASKVHSFTRECKNKECASFRPTLT